MKGPTLISMASALKLPVLAAVAVLGVRIAWADEGAADSTASRRTPVVAVFEQCRDSVVYVTGPIFKVRKPSLEEFFILPGKKPPISSVGSGFAVHESGYVLTNAHAAEKVIYPEVTLSDGRTCRADLIASIHEEDVALLKIDAGRPLKPVRLARSGDVMIGETVIVIAHPHGLRHTCTAGVVSALGRTTTVSDIEDLTLRDLIQTDAAINPGSSGGPWFNVLGEVMGLTASQKRDAENIGFAVSVATIRRLLPEMLDVDRRYGLVTGLSVAGDGQCRVTAVEADSPAARAGILAGDVLQRMADGPTPTVVDFHLGLAGRKPGQTVRLELLREGKPVEASLELGRRPKPDGATLLRQRLGLTGAPLSKEKAEAMAFQVPCGVLITAVDPRFFATVDHKPAPGDVLGRIAKSRPRDLDHLGLILEKLRPGEPVTMVLLRHKANRATRVDIKLTLPE